MKKALAMALGAMLVAGAAAPAFAASQIDFKGSYAVTFDNVWNSNFASQKDNADNDSYFADRLTLDFTFNATDEVAVYWRVRGPRDVRWGTSPADAGGNRNGLVSHFIYGEVKQDWGTISVGRLAHTFVDIGLADLGHSLTYVDGDGLFGYGSPFDWDTPKDGIRWANRWDNGFQLVAQYNRWATSHDGRDIATPINDAEYENVDIFILEPAYLWDGGGATLALMYARDHVQDLAKLAGKNPTIPASKLQVPALKAYYINPAVSHNFGDFTVNFEGKAGWGKINDIDPSYRVLGITNLPAVDEIKAKGYAFYLDFDYNYGPGNVTLAGWWASGTKVEELEADNYKGLVGMGGAFAPFIVAYGDGYGWGNATNAIAAAEELNNGGVNGIGLDGPANHWAIAITGAHAFTDDVTLLYGLCYLSLNKVSDTKYDSTGNPVADTKGEKNIGFETDLGLKVQLLDNLSFTTNLGYLFAGNALKDENGDKENAYAWYNTLTFSF